MKFKKISLILLLSLLMVYFNACGELSVLSPTTLTLQQISSSSTSNPLSVSNIRLQAEDALNKKSILDIGTKWGDPSFEASQKQTMKLVSVGDYLAWKSPQQATHLNIRYSLDDTKTAQLTIFINNQNKIVLNLDSSHLFESKPKSNGGPTGDLVRFFDDTLIEIPGGIQKDDLIQISLSNSTSSKVLIDFIELENKDSSLSPPDDSWQKVSNSTELLNQIGKGTLKIWLMPGDYAISSSITLKTGTKIRGSGWWYTKILWQNLSVNQSLFVLTGNNELADFKVIGSATTLISQNTLIRADSSTNNLVEKIWAEYLSLFLGFNSSNNVIRLNRVRNAYKDCIHLARASQSNTISYNEIRNCGDDSIALVSYDTAGMKNNLVQANTIEFGYWGRGITNIGGDSNQILNNTIMDHVQAGIMTGSETYSGLTTVYNTNWHISGNTITRCGNDLNALYGGAVSIFNSNTNSFSGIFEKNQILSPPYNGIQISGNIGNLGASNTVEILSNPIDKPLNSSLEFLDISNQAGKNTFLIIQ